MWLPTRACFTRGDWACRQLGRQVDRTTGQLDRWTGRDCWVAGPVNWTGLLGSRTHCCTDGLFSRTDVGLLKMDGQSDSWKRCLNSGQLELIEAVVGVTA